MAEGKGFPKTREALERAGYKYLNTALCRGKTCKRHVEWWETPNGKRIPMDEMPDATSEATAHWATCPDESRFRR